MTIEELLPRLEAVRRSSRGYVARCPAHPDRSPSLSLREGDDGRILVYCFAGCSVQDVCAALGIEISDLFAQSGSAPRQCRGQHRGHGRIDLESTAFQFRFHAEGLWLRAQAALDDLMGVDVCRWDDNDRDAAMEAVVHAYDDLERADLLDAVAFGIRQRGLENDRKRYASQKPAA